MLASSAAPCVMLFASSSPNDCFLVAVDGRAWAGIVGLRAVDLEPFQTARAKHEALVASESSISVWRGML